MYNLAFDTTEASSFIQNALRDVFFAIDKIVYMLVAFIYKVFYYLATAKFMSDDIVTGIISRIGIILGVVMLFKTAISLLQLLLDPDSISDKEKGIGKLVLRAILVVVMLASVNLVFKELYKMQEIVINNRTIEKIMIGDADTMNGSNKSAGIEFSKNLFFSFFRDDQSPYIYSVHINNIVYCLSRNQTGTSGDSQCVPSSDDNYIYDLVDDEVYFRRLTNFVNLKGSGESEYIFEYNYLLSTVVGVFAGYILVTYCFGVGTRIFELAFLQIISPIPIISYLTKKGEEKFKKWVAQCTSAFLDVFMRLLIINFAMYIITLLFEEDRVQFVNTFVGENNFTQAMIKVALVLAVLMFAKKAPELIKELFPAGRDMGLSLKNKFKDNLAGKGLALLGSAATLGAGKLRAGIDARKNGLRFRDGTRQVRANNKLRKWLDDTAPYSREQRKKQLEAGSNNYAREKLIDDGRDNYWNNNGTLTANSFSNKDYRNSWQSVEDAKATVKTAETEFAEAQSELNAAYSSGDTAAKNRAVERYKEAQKAVKSANGVLEYRKQRHEDMKKLHSADARIEDSFDAYKKATSDEEKAQDKANRGKNGRGGNSSEGNTAQAPNVTGATGNGVTQNSSSSSSPSFFGDDGGESGE